MSATVAAKFVVVDRMAPPDGPKPTPTQVADAAVVQATCLIRVTPFSLAVVQAAPAPPQADEPPEVRVPVVMQVMAAAPGHWTPLSTAAEPP